MVYGNWIFYYLWNIEIWKKLLSIIVAGFVCLLVDWLTEWSWALAAAWPASPPSRWSGCGRARVHTLGEPACRSACAEAGVAAEAATGAQKWRCSVTQPPSCPRTWCCRRRAGLVAAADCAAGSAPTANHPLFTQKMKPAQHQKFWPRSQKWKEKNCLKIKRTTRKHENLYWLVTGFWTLIIFNYFLGTILLEKLWFMNKLVKIVNCSIWFFKRLGFRFLFPFWFLGS